MLKIPNGWELTWHFSGQPRNLTQIEWHDIQDGELICTLTQPVRQALNIEHKIITIRKEQTEQVREWNYTEYRYDDIYGEYDSYLEIQDQHGNYYCAGDHLEDLNNAIYWLLEEIKEENCESIIN